MTPILSDAKQGSSAWHDARLGVVTASRVADVVTLTGKATKSASRQRYMQELLFERLTGREANSFVTPAMERGTMLEPQARAWYELTADTDVRQVGFVTCDELKGRAGCSPDGLVGDARGIEIKCPMPVNIIGLLLEDDAEAAKDYAAQIQFCMWICARTEWDLVLFSDEQGIPSRIITIAADPVLQAAFAEHIPAFCAELDAAEAKLRAMGGGINRATAMRDQFAELEK